MNSKKREAYEEGLFFYLKEFIQQNSLKAPEHDLKLKAHKRWLRMNKQIRSEYQKKAIEEQEYNNEQQKGKKQEKEQEEVEQQIEAPIEKKKNQRGKGKRNVTASPQPKKGRQKKKAQSVDNEDQVVQQKRGRTRKQNGEPKTRARTGKTKQQKKQEKEEQDDEKVEEKKEEEEQAQLKQHIQAIANSKVGYQHGNQKEKIDTLHLHKRYDLEFNIRFYENKIMDDKIKNKKNKK